MAETVLVTGGSGYIAGWCIVELLRRGFAVHTTVRKLPKADAVRATIAAAIDPGDRLTFFAADLTAAAGWDAAVAGCDYVLHVASPLVVENSNDPGAYITPARDGALHVLRAATQAGVKRVVMTSACAASSPPSYRTEGVTDESLWTDPEEKGLSAYRKSKTMAELAAWQFMKEYHGPTSLTTILPGAIFGPVLSADNPGTAQIIGRIVQGRLPGIPRLAFEVVDVRDIADIHIRAMTAEAAAGERFIAVSELMWMADIAELLRTKLGPAGGKIPTRRLPDFVLRFLALFNDEIRSIAPGLGRKHRHNAEKALRLLGWQPRPAAVTVVDCAESLIAQGAL